MGWGRRGQEKRVPTGIKHREIRRTWTWLDKVGGNGEEGIAFSKTEELESLAQNNWLAIEMEIGNV